MTNIYTIIIDSLAIAQMDKRKSFKIEQLSEE